MLAPPEAENDPPGADRVSSLFVCSGMLVPGKTKQCLLTGVWSPGSCGKLYIKINIILALMTDAELRTVRKAAKRERIKMDYVVKIT